MTADKNKNYLLLFILKYVLKKYYPQKLHHEKNRQVL